MIQQNNTNNDEKKSAFVTADLHSSGQGRAGWSIRINTVMKQVCSLRGMFLLTGFCLLFALSILYIRSSAETTKSDSPNQQNTIPSDKNIDKTENTSKTTDSKKTSTNKKSSSDKKNTDSKTDEATNQDNEEMLGVWLSFLDYESWNNESEFRQYVDTTFSNCKKAKATDVFVQVRPYSDAMYKSDYYPWSRYASGTQGVDPGYDPLEIMVEKAHAMNLKIHAWINPYRIANGNTNTASFSADHPARIWSASNLYRIRRRVLSYNGNLYYNPARPAARKLIINGVKEIVKNYDVDGIHMDDYFYPTMDASTYTTVFDSKEYNTYVKYQKNKGLAAMDIVSWRRENVNILVRDLYSAVKKLDEDCVFGISPGGTISNLYSNYGDYCDVKKWMAESGYIDYICPQIYWSFTQSYSPFDQVTDAWSEMKVNDDVKLYIGLAVYRAGISQSEAASLSDMGWCKTDSMLKTQVEYARKKENVDGYLLFRYTNIVSSAARKEMENFLSMFE